MLSCLRKWLNSETQEVSPSATRNVGNGAVYIYSNIK